jgi:hypothetical protein
MRSKSFLDPSYGLPPFTGHGWLTLLHGGVPRALAAAQEDLAVKVLLET